MGDVVVESGGHLEVEGDLDVGQDGDCCGGLDVRRGTVNVGGSLHVGTYGTGSLDIEDGPVDVDGALGIGAPGTTTTAPSMSWRLRAEQSPRLERARVHRTMLRATMRVHTVGTASVGPEGAVNFKASRAWRITDALFVGSGSRGRARAWTSRTPGGGSRSDPFRGRA
jgi:hypothetical protein